MVMPFSIMYPFNVKMSAFISSGMKCIFAPAIMNGNISMIEASKLQLCTAHVLSSGVMSKYSLQHQHRLRSPRSGESTPFGFPFEPDVCMM